MTPTLLRSRLGYARAPLSRIGSSDARAAGDLADWLLWLELAKAAPTTRRAYESTCADLLEAFPGKTFAEFTDGDLMRLLLSYPEKSQRIRKAHLASWFRWGYQQRRIPANPVDLLPRLKQPHQPVQDIFTPAEEAKLRALPSPDGHLMTLLFLTGLRKAEARNLTGRRIDFDRRIVIVSEGAKGSRDRVIPMTVELEQAMADMFLVEDIRPDDYLWYDKPGGPFAVRLRRSKPIADTSFGRWWTRCIDAAGVRYRNPHVARHTCATRWRELRVDLDDIQAFLGHASIKTTSDLYVHADATARGDRLRALALAHSSGETGVAG